MRYYRLLSLVLISLSFWSCASQTEKTTENPFSGQNPWPEIRNERIQNLLPQAMQRAGTDAWAVLCRSNNNDPLARHIGCENAVAPAVYLFELRDGSVFSTVFTPPGEAAALQDIALHDSIAVVDRSPGALVEAANYINQNISGTLALNFSENNKIADGLSHSQYILFTDMLIQPVKNQIISSEELVFEWLSVKLPAEIEIMKRAAEITAQWQLDAYAQVIPNESTDRDVADFLEAKMREIEVDNAWSPDQNPAVNSGPDRGHAHPTERVIRPGDVIQIDFGIKVYDMWVTDIQRLPMCWDRAKPMPRKIFSAIGMLRETAAEWFLKYFSRESQGWMQTECRESGWPKTGHKT
jgi:Xaa-Pro aminopeptidase